MEVLVLVGKEGGRARAAAERGFIRGAQSIVAVQCTGLGHLPRENGFDMVRRRTLLMVR